MLENFTVTPFPDNRPVEVEEDRDSITRGATCKHIFELPFLCKDYIKTLTAIYNQGLDTILKEELDISALGDGWSLAVDEEGTWALVVDADSDWSLIVDETNVNSVLDNGSGGLVFADESDIPEMNEEASTIIMEDDSIWSAVDEEKGWSVFDYKFNDKSILILILTPEDTIKFEANLLDVYVQLKIVTIAGETLYSTPIKLILDLTLDN